MTSDGTKRAEAREAYAKLQKQASKGKNCPMFPNFKPSYPNKGNQPHGCTCFQNGNQVLNYELNNSAAYLTIWCFDASRKERPRTEHRATWKSSSTGNRITIDLSPSPDTVFWEATFGKPPKPQTALPRLTQLKPKGCSYSFLPKWGTSVEPLAALRRRAVKFSARTSGGPDRTGPSRADRRPGTSQRSGDRLPHSPPPPPLSLPSASTASEGSGFKEEREG